MPSDAVAIYLSIGMAAWLLIDAVFGATAAVAAEWRARGKTPKQLAIGAIFGAVAMIALWPFLLGYRLICLMSAPLER